MRKKPLLTILLLLITCSTSVFAQTGNRIIRADRNNADDVIEIVSIKLGETPVRINEMFSADEKWLKQLRIRVKNIGDRDIICLVIAPGLLEGVDDKLGPSESWGWKLPFGFGCSDKTDGKAVLKKGSEIELGFENVGSLYREKVPVGKFHKAVLAWARVIFENGEEDDVRLAFPRDTHYLDDRAY